MTAYELGTGTNGKLFKITTSDGHIPAAGIVLMVCVPPLHPSVPNSLTRLCAKHAALSRPPPACPDKASVAAAGKGEDMSRGSAVFGIAYLTSLLAEKLKLPPSCITLHAGSPPFGVLGDITSTGAGDVVAFPNW